MCGLCVSPQEDEWGTTHGTGFGMVGRHLLNLWRIMRGEVSVIILIITPCKYNKGCCRASRLRESCDVPGGVWGWNTQHCLTPHTASGCYRPTGILPASGGYSRTHSGRSSRPTAYTFAQASACEPVNPEPVNPQPAHERRRAWHDPVELHVNVISNVYFKCVCAPAAEARHLHVRELLRRGAEAARAPHPPHTSRGVVHGRWGRKL